MLWETPAHSVHCRPLPTALCAGVPAVLSQEGDSKSLIELPASRSSSHHVTRHPRSTRTAKDTTGTTVVSVAVLVLLGVPAGLL